LIQGNWNSNLKFCASLGMKPLQNFVRDNSGSSFDDLAKASRLFNVYYDNLSQIIRSIVDKSSLDRVYWTSGSRALKNKARTVYAWRGNNECTPPKFDPREINMVALTCNDYQVTLFYL
jgi:hypothetical protein